MAFERTEIITERGVHHIYEYESEHAANNGAAPLNIRLYYPPGVGDWQGFINRLHVASESNPEGTGLFEVFRQANEVLAWQAFSIALGFVRGFGGETELETLRFLYSELSSGLSAPQLSSLNQAITDFNIPVSIEA